MTLSKIKLFERKNVMKIKAIVGDSTWNGYNEGEIFEAELSDSGENYIFIDNDGDERLRPIEEFEVVGDEQEKEEEMKVIAIEGCHPNLTVGKVYEVVSKSYCGRYWRVVNDNGFTDGYQPANHFKLFEDKPNIEVGSIWIHDNGLEYEVTAVGEKKVLLKYNGEEYPYSISHFGGIIKPKPKTVTMYFYEKSGGGYDAFDFELGASYNGLAFTREIELP